MSLATNAITLGPAGCALIPSSALNCEGRGETSPGSPALPGVWDSWGSLEPFLDLVRQGPIPGQSPALVLPLPFQLASTSPAGTQSPEGSVYPPSQHLGAQPHGPPASRVGPGPGWDCSQQPRGLQTLQDVGRGTSEADRRLVEGEEEPGCPHSPSLLLIRKMGLNQALKQEVRPAGRRLLQSTQAGPSAARADGGSLPTHGAPYKVS